MENNNFVKKNFFPVVPSEATDNKLSPDDNNKHFYLLLFFTGVISPALSNFRISITEMLYVDHAGTQGPKVKMTFFWTYEYVLIFN